MKDFGAVGTIVEGNEGDKCNYPMRLDTYGCGCQHDCSYCYAKSLLDFRGLWNPKNPSVAPIQKISREIRKIPKGTVVRLGGMTETYLDIGTYTKSFYSVMACPSCVKVSVMGNKDMRVHHKVCWRNAVPKILNEKWRKY